MAKDAPRIKAEVRIDSRIARCQFFAVVTQSMRQMWKAVPFRPFVIQMNDGRKFEVPHPDFLSIFPKGTEILVYDKNEASHFISPLLVASLTPTRLKRPKKSD